VVKVNSNFGICHICGTYGKLSFEHVPPRAAFNDRRILHVAFEKIITIENFDRIDGKIQQRGAGAYTLCGSCNNDTGRWYGGAFAGWAHQAMRIIIDTRGRPSLRYPFNLFPLRVLKQVICMFFSVNGPRFQQVQPELVRFVLDRYSKSIPNNLRVYAFYTYSNRSRAAGMSGIVRGLGTTRSSVHVFSEITFPPFGFALASTRHLPPEANFCDITEFSQFEYRDWRWGVTMKLPFMPVYTGFPGDYRTRDQAIADFEQSRCPEAKLRAGHQAASRQS
jgi:hypothetical protein